MEAYRVRPPRSSPTPPRGQMLHPWMVRHTLSEGRSTTAIVHHHLGRHSVAWLPLRHSVVYSDLVSKMVL